MYEDETKENGFGNTEGENFSSGEERRDAFERDMNAYWGASSPQENPYQADSYNTASYDAGPNVAGGNNSDLWQQPARRTSAPKSRTGGLVFLIIGGILLAAGLGFLLFGGKRLDREEGDPVDIYQASRKGQYAFTNVQYLTYSVACYEALDSLNFYIAMDEDWNTSVICVHDSNMTSFEPYIDWLFSEEEEGGPEEISVTGYAQPFDDELKDYVLEEFVYLFEVDLSKSEFEDYFGKYYLQVGESDDVYQTSNIGLILLLGALIPLAIGAVKFFGAVNERSIPEGGAIIREERAGVGVLGAFLGASLGGLIWTLVHIMGFVSGWVGLLIMVFAYSGYKLLANKESSFGKIISFVFGLLIIIPATYLAWGWEYYSILNKQIDGYTSLMRALLSMPAFLKSTAGWGDFVSDLVQGYLFMGIVAIYWLVSGLKNRD